MKKAIIYTRTATVEQNGNNNSLDQQAKLLREYCKSKGIHIVHHFQEEFPGSNFNRPEWNKLMEYVQANKGLIDLIVFTRWDRLARNLQATLEVMKKLKSLGIELMCVEYPLDFGLPENKLMLAMLLTMPEIENDKNSLRTKEGMREIRKQGYWTGKAPLGYKNKRDENGKPTLEVNDKAPIVKQTFEVISSGLYTCEEVRRKINKVWRIKISKQSFLNMLNNIAYSGSVLIPEWKKEETQVVQGVHPAIVAKELFDKVQVVLKERRKQPKSHVQRLDKLTLRGHLECPKCNVDLTKSGIILIPQPHE